MAKYLVYVRTEIDYQVEVSQADTPEQAIAAAVNGDGIAYDRKIFTSYRPYENVQLPSMIAPILTGGEPAVEGKE